MLRADLNAVRLLLDYKADPNAFVGDMSMISIAANCGYPEVLYMLIESGAKLYPACFPPLLTVLNSGNKLCLSVLLQNRTKDVIRKIDGKILLYHAIIAESSLVPVIANITNQEIQKLKDSKEASIPEFPPKGLSSSQKKELNQVLTFKEELLPLTNIIHIVKKVKQIWAPVNE